MADLKVRRNQRKKGENKDTQKWLEETLEQITELELVSQRQSAIPC